MKSVNKLYIILCIILFVFTCTAQAEIMRVQGEMNSSITAYITRRFSSYSETKNLTYRMYFPPSQTEGLHTQTISKLRKSFTPFPTETHDFVDAYGNSGSLLVWNKEIRIIQMDVQFSAKIFSHFYTINSTAPYPVGVNERLKIFLSSTQLSPSNDFMINYVGRSIAYDLNREIDVVNNVFLWMDENISLMNSTDDEMGDDALSVLKNRSGTEKGLCNLAASIFKGLGIPVRVVYGISFQQEISVKTDDKSYIYDYPNDEKYWLEVHFPDLGWVAYDPMGTHFGTTSHLIKFSVGPDSAFASDTWEVEQGDLVEFKEFIFDIRSDLSTLEPIGSIENGSLRLVLSPEIESFIPLKKEPDLDVGDISIGEGEEIEPSPEAGILVHNSGIVKRLDIVATQSRIYAQRFTLDAPARLNQVNLPLIKFSDEGRIWLEVYDDDNGKPGNVLFKTFSIHSPRIRFMMMENPWLNFPVGNRTDSLLDSGSYWIALRSSGSCIFNWFASAGNVIGPSVDTRFKDVGLKNPHWDNIMNFDMNFQIIGTPVDIPPPQE
jgi:transglutaminase-like putative cysteine protease